MHQINYYLRSHYPELSAIREAPWQEAEHRARLVSYPAGSTLFRTGDACNNFLLLLEGSIRVQKLSHDGHEIVLYHVKPGDICEITTTCLLGGAHYPAEGITETTVRAVVFAKEHFQHLLSKTEPFRRYVFSSIDKGLAGLINLVEDIAFGPMDRRLGQCLLNLTDAQGTVYATHHSLAVELGTAREVISRLLKTFEHHGWVQLFRGHIVILNSRALKQLQH